MAILVFGKENVSNMKIVVLYLISYILISNMNFFYVAKHMNEFIFRPRYFTLMLEIEAYISKDDFRDILKTVKIPDLLVQE